MRKLLKYLKSSALIIIAIFAILVVQAYCDLSLPSYTSDIVNVGIQQGGISETVPQQIRKSELNKLLLFVTPEDQKTVTDAYRESESYTDAYELKKSVLNDDEQMSDLSNILGKPMLVVSGLNNDSDQTKTMKEKLMASVPKEMLTKDTTVFDVLAMMQPEQLTPLVEKINEQFSKMPESIVEQAATVYIKAEYQALKIDTDAIQNSYIFTAGVKMLLLALLGMIASVIVGFLASRVGSSVARDMRGNVFRKVVGFSSREYDEFSTASLITRSTNDIQQIQMMIIMMLRMIMYAPILGIGGILKV
ncbi:MAG: ABC transporter transmembrane domain-containing protein, partial [Lachnospiraceae bacterium]|nr:ABC transporter transmembrane domain-containing protein [Lachnospiraceae bacterium]